MSPSEIATLETGSEPSKVKSTDSPKVVVAKAWLIDRLLHCLLFLSLAIIIVGLIGANPGHERGHFNSRRTAQTWMAGVWVGPLLFFVTLWGLYRSKTGIADSAGYPCLAIALIFILLPTLIGISYAGFEEENYLHRQLKSHMAAYNANYLIVTGFSVIERLRTVYILQMGLGGLFLLIQVLCILLIRPACCAQPNTNRNLQSA